MAVPQMWRCVLAACGVEARLIRQGWQPVGLKDTEIANRLGITVPAFKNYKRRKAKLEVLPGSPDVEAAMSDVAQRLGLEVTDAMRAVLLADATTKQASLPHQVSGLLSIAE